MTHTVSNISSVELVIVLKIQQIQMMGVVSFLVMEKRSVAVAETNVVKVKEFASTTFIVKKDLSVGIIIVKENNMKQQTDVVNTHVKEKKIAAVVQTHAVMEMEFVIKTQIVFQDLSVELIIVIEMSMAHQTIVVNNYVIEKSIAAIVFIRVEREMELVNMIQIVNKGFSAKMSSVNLTKPVLYHLLLVSVYPYF